MRLNMTASEKTKHKFAEALIKLTGQRAFADITVADLCREVDCQRATFYYHFEDKYALVAWIYVDGQRKVFENCGYPIDKEHFVQALDTLNQNRGFYRQVLADEALSGLYKHMRQYYARLFEQMVRHKTGDSSISRELAYSIQYAVAAGFDLTRAWLCDPERISKEEIIDIMIDNMPQRLKSILFE